MVSLFLTLFIIEGEFLLRSSLFSFYEAARFFHKSYKSSPPLLLHHFEVLVMYTADSQRTTAKIEDELTVALDANDVALVALEGAGEDAGLTWSLANFSRGSRRKVRRSGWMRETFMKGRMMASSMEAGQPRLRSLTR